MADSIPTSLRLQTKLMADKFPDSNSKSHAVIYFVEEEKYSVVSSKVIQERNFKVKQKVGVKDARGVWPGLVMFQGTEDACKRRQSVLAKALVVDVEEDIPLQPKRKANECKEKKNKKIKALQSDEDDDDDDSDYTFQDIGAEKEDLLEEQKRVEELLAKKHEVQVSKLASTIEVEAVDDKPNQFQETVMKEFKKISLKLEEIESLVRRACKTPLQSHEGYTRQEAGSSSQDSLNSSFTGESPHQVKCELPFNATEETEIEIKYNGTNLLTDVQAKQKKPKLYATALLSVLFTDEEMRNGCVEPKDGGARKPPLDQSKINMIKRCINVKYGAKVLDKMWSDIRVSLNQKCLDKLKSYKSKQSAAARNSNED